MHNLMEQWKHLLFPLNLSLSHLPCMGWWLLATHSNFPKWGKWIGHIGKLIIFGLNKIPNIYYEWSRKLRRRTNTKWNAQRASAKIHGAHKSAEGCQSRQNHRFQSLFFLIWNEWNRKLKLQHEYATTDTFIKRQQPVVSMHVASNPFGIMVMWTFSAWIYITLITIVIVLNDFIRTTQKNWWLLFTIYVFSLVTLKGLRYL